MCIIYIHILNMYSTTKRIILDADFGIDDAFALLTLLYVELLGLVKIEAIVCSLGNSEVNNVCKNTVRLLETFNRTDIPVFQGASKALISDDPLSYYYGKDGFGDLTYSKEPNLDIIQKEPAAVGLRKIVTDNPGEISLICIGPLTNVALSMNLYDDFIDNIKEVFIMGGNDPDNNVAEAEYNFRVDPEGAYIVFKNVICPVSVMTFETSMDTHITFDWRFNVLGMKGTPFMDLLNKAEKNIYPAVTPTTIWYPYDVFLIVAMLFPDESIIKQEKYNVKIELNEGNVKGKVILDESKPNEPNFTFIKKVNDEFTKEILLKAATL